MASASTCARSAECARNAEQAVLAMCKKRWLELEEKVKLEEQAKLAWASLLDKHEADKQRLAGTVASLESDMAQPLKHKHIRYHRAMRSSFGFIGHVQALRI